MIINIDSRRELSYINGMISSYRRDNIAKSLFRLAEILFGAGAVSIWFSQIPLPTKLVAALGIVILFVGASLVCPKKAPAGE